jgi:hypothetical protein
MSEIKKKRTSGPGRIRTNDPRHVKAAHLVCKTIIIICVGHESESLLSHYGGCEARWFKPLPIQ